jgi:hypothetical protein
LLAAENGHEAVVKLLLEKGADIGWRLLQNLVITLHNPEKHSWSVGFQLFGTL